MRRARVALTLLVMWAAGCSGEPGGQEWQVVEIDEGMPAADMGGNTIDEGTTTQPDAEITPQQLPTGSPCTTDDECMGGTCLRGDQFPGGLCTTMDCTVDGCGDGANCSLSDAGNFCAAECTSDSDCREGFGCRREGRRNETPRRMCTPIRGVPDGEACASRSDCQGGFCMDWAGGYCTTFGCSTSDDCSNLGLANNVCLDSGGGFNLCVRSCAASTDCRDGYICEDVGGGESACLEDPAQPFDPSVFADSALHIQCGVPVENGQASFEYEIDPATTSYMVTPLAKDGQPIDPLRIVLPDQTEKNFNLERQVFKVPASFFASMNPTLVPGAPKFSDMLAAGTNRYDLAADGSEICYYVLEKSAPGAVLDLNVYLVGVPGVTAASAATDPNFSALFAEVSRIYEQVGITLGEIRYFDTSDEDAMRFGVLRSEAEVGELTKRSKPPGADLHSILSVNVFFTGQFAMRGVIGISSGLPGPAGLHGTHGSGVVFTAEYMGEPVDDALGNSTDGNLYTALLLAHEVGHWLGLFHTSEARGGSWDPLDDTGECSDPASQYDSCADWGNLMFPFAFGGNTNLTPEQGFVLGANPLTQAAPGVTP